ncbi:MAG: hypothetical protein AB1644_09270 [Candidatus Zixiibacteriota bacterium]
MRKLLILTLVLVFALGSMAFATRTRVLTMGNNNNVLLDDANIWLYPSRINQYPNLGIAEMENYQGFDDFYQFGIHWKFSESNPWVLGTYISLGPDDLPSTYSTSEISNYSFTSNYWWYEYGAAKPSDVIINTRSTNRRIDLLYGRKFGTTQFGFGFGYSHGSDSRKWDDTLNTKYSFSKYTVALGLTPEDGKWDVAISYSMGTWTDESPLGYKLTEPDGYYDFMIGGRYIYQYNPTINFVPHAAATFGSHGQKVDSAGWADDPWVDDNGIRVKSKQAAFELGCGMQYMPTTNVLAVLDFGIQYRSVKNTDIAWKGTSGSSPRDDQKERTFNIPYWRIGLEGEVFNWMDVRLGATSDWQSFKAEWDQGSTTYSSNYDEVKSNWAENTTFLGVGLNFNRLHIDTYTDPQIVLDGFNFISGSDEADHLNFQVSVLYEMF